jgi:hypothetical protein
MGELKPYELETAIKNLSRKVIAQAPRKEGR